MGDALLFARYVPLVARRGVKVVLEVQSPLKQLLAGTEGVGAIVAAGEPLPAFDLHCPLPSLPLAFGTELATIPPCLPGLNVSRQALAAWHERVASPKLRVGLAWSGSPAYLKDRSRSIAFSRLTRLLDVPGIQFVSLYRDQDLRSEDRESLCREPRVIHFGQEQKDLGDAAALISSLDLAISVDTSLAHLAGALGRPVWILLAFSPDWRWMLQREDSSWYPTARLFRQPTNGDWDSVIEQVGRALVQLTPLP
jgi:hypothetical protein